MTKHGLRAFAITALAGVALIAAGCGGTEAKNNYVDEVNQIQTDALDAVTSATSANPDNKGDYVAQLGKAQDAIDEAITKLGAVDVPTEAEQGHQQFVDGLQAMSDLFGATANKLKGASGADLVSVVTDLQTKGTQIGNDIDAAINKINTDIGAS